jgi:hypothetical protein
MRYGTVFKGRGTDASVIAKQGAVLKLWTFYAKEKKPSI